MAWSQLDFCCVGGINGIALCIDKLRKEKNQTGIIKIVKIAITFLFISFTWIFFRSDTFSTAGCVISRLFTLKAGIQHLFVWTFISIAAIAIGTVFAKVKANKLQTVTNGYYPILNLNSIPGLTVFFVEIGVIFAVAYTGENPFVYFRF